MKRLTSFHRSLVHRSLRFRAESRVAVQMPAQRSRELKVRHRRKGLCIGGSSIKHPFQVMVRTYRTHMHPVLKNGDIRRICPNVLRGLSTGIRRATHERLVWVKPLLCGAQAPCPVFRHHKPRSKPKWLLKVFEPFWPCPSLLGWFSCKLVLPDMQNRNRPPTISRKNYGKTISEQGS